jgi:hypothetical protein
MKADQTDESDLIRLLFDVVPSYLFVVDEDMRIEVYNEAAHKLVGEDSQMILKRRGGEAFHCLHEADSPEGCGHGMHCQTCVIRSAVTEAFDGNKVVRRRTKMEVLGQTGYSDMYALITTSPFIYKGRRLVLLLIEDVSQVIELQCLIPICSKCKKVRADKDYWTKLEVYAQDHLGADFSHGYCPDCFKAEMEKLDKELPRREGKSKV